MSYTRGNKDKNKLIAFSTNVEARRLQLEPKWDVLAQAFIMR